MGGLVSKVVIPVKTGIQIDIIRYDFWIPTCVGMTKRLKNSTYDTKLGWVTLPLHSTDLRVGHPVAPILGRY